MGTLHAYHSTVFDKELSTEKSNAIYLFREWPLITNNVPLCAISALQSINRSTALISLWHWRIISSNNLLITKTLLEKTTE